MKFLVSQLL